MIINWLAFLISSHISFTLFGSAEKVAEVQSSAAVSA
jgi:hypothetical protein